MARYLRLSAVLVCIACLSGCTHVPLIGDLAADLMGGYAAPEATSLEGVRRVAQVGEVLTSNRPLRVERIVTLDEPLSGRFTRRGKEIRVRLPPGPYKLVAGDADARYFAADRPLEASIDGKAIDAYGGIRMSTDGSHRADAYWLEVPVRKPELAHFAPLSFVPPDLWNSRRENLTPVADADSPTPVATLSYAGMADGKVRLVYREDGPGEAGGASENIELDFAPNAELRYKYARLIIHDADEAQIDYSLVESL